jgi:hypothetical protein
VALRIKENFTVPHTITGGALQVRKRQVIKILLGNECGCALIIKVEK